MPKYENPIVPEGINVPEESQVKEFFILALALTLVTVIAVVVISLLAEHFAEKISFATEKQLADVLLQPNAESQTEHLDTQIDMESSTAHQIENYLQKLANELARKQELPAGMSVTLHYKQDDVINAFATLGGNIFIHQGLLEKLPHENALAMVVAHEIAHVKFRDPIVSLGRGVTILVALSVFSGGSDSVIGKNLLGQVGTLTALSFSREQESRADEEALKTLYRYYGHVTGAEVLFEVLGEQRGGVEPPAFLSTHPITEGRIENIAAFAEKNQSDGEIKALPSFIRLK